MTPNERQLWSQIRNLGERYDRLRRVLVLIAILGFVALTSGCPVP